MVHLLLFASWLEVANHFSLYHWLSPLSQEWQEHCGNLWTGSTLRPLGRALICGQDLQEIHLKNLFRETGLYHVLVVSGTHLTWLSALLTLGSGRRHPLLIVALILYSLVTGLQPPVIRALFHWFLSPFFPSPFKAKVVFYSYLASLLFHPPWIHSLSLQLSVVASLILSFKRSSAWVSGLMIHFLLIPLLAPLSVLHPLGAMTGILLAGVVELFCFPLCLAALALPFLQSMVDGILHALIQLLGEIAQLLPPLSMTPKRKLSPWFTALYPLGLWLLVEIFGAREARRFYFIKRD